MFERVNGPPASILYEIVPSQISLDDRRRLYVKAEEEKRYTAYGSISYQIREANEEASGFFDFMGRALAIVGTSGQ